MRIRELLEDDHNTALTDTGFWGHKAAGCLFCSTSTKRFLIAHRSDNVQEPNTWGTWGGAIDKGEKPEDTVRREVTEEAGYHGEYKLVPLWVFNHHSGFQYLNFLAIVEDEFDPKLDWENQGYKWVEYGDWPQPLHPGLSALIKNDSTLINYK